VFEEQKLSGLTTALNDKTILYDYDELSKAPAEYRDFVLMAACARNAQAEPREAECTAIKRVRDEKGVSKEKGALIAQHLSSSPGTDDKDARARSLYSCFNARKLIASDDAQRKGLRLVPTSGDSVPSIRGTGNASTFRVINCALPDT
jgi:hypothetical protein